MEPEALKDSLIYDSLKKTMTQSPQNRFSYPKNFNRNSLQGQKAYEESRKTGLYNSNVGRSSTPLNFSRDTTLVKYSTPKRQ